MALNSFTPRPNLCSFPDVNQQTFSHTHTFYFHKLVFITLWTFLNSKKNEKNSLQFDKLQTTTFTITTTTQLMKKNSLKSLLSLENLNQNHKSNKFYKLNWIDVQTMSVMMKFMHLITITTIEHTSCRACVCEWVYENIYIKSNNLTKYHKYYSISTT